MEVILSKCVAFCLKKGPSQKGKNLLRSKFFPFRVRPLFLQKGLKGLQESKQIVTEVVFLVKKYKIKTTTKKNVKILLSVSSAAS